MAAGRRLAFLAQHSAACRQAQRSRIEPAGWQVAGSQPRLSSHRIKFPEHINTKGLSYGSSFCGNGTPAPQANFFKEYSRYTFKKSAPLSKEEGTPEIISRPANFF
jgi:hypothetical protein